ncbi:retrovirus-related pol polyprotein from transposon TNT 1-94 [Tanacetum coccineum]|uniref:Retrovirus-related pol polyprotein from transposon TNT 1-94 n=1 Tax=Tanacetum coccineum TaxID=301880 RepID=A0ABQ5G1I6_9ASTR
MCFVRDLQGNDLLTSNRGSDVYTISLQETTSSTTICLMAKASPTQAWLWHRRLSHINFDYINLLSKKDIVIGLPKLKYVKDQLSSSCEVSKAKRSSFKIKAVPSSKGRLNLLHMDLCGPMRVTSINEKKYIPELDLLFGPLYDEFFNAGTSRVNKSSSPNDNSTQQDTQPSTNIQPTSEPTTPTHAHAEENNDNQAEDTKLEFTNPFCTPVQEVAESSSRNIANANKTDNLQPESAMCCSHSPKNFISLTDFKSGNSLTNPLARTWHMKTDFLIGHLKERFMLHNYTIHDPNIQDKVTVEKTLYGLKQAPRACCAQVMWMRTQLQDYGFNYNKIPLYCDSQSAIAISCNPVQHSRTKNIYTRYHFIKEHVENGIIELYFVRTEYQLVDMFTKALPKDRFQYLVRRIGMRCLTTAELEVLTNESA